MKTTIKQLLLGFLVLVFTTNATLAHSKNDHHTEMTKHHFSMLGFLKWFKGGKTKSKEPHKYNAVEMQTHLDKAKEHHKELKKNMPKEFEDVAKPHHEAIEKYHKDAEKHHKALNSELAKTEHDEEKAREHALRLHSALSKAEGENQLLKKKTQRHK